MDQTTVQTIIEGGILVALAWIGSSTASIAKNTSSGGTQPKNPPDPED